MPTCTILDYDAGRMKDGQICSREPDKISPYAVPGRPLPDKKNAYAALGNEGDPYVVWQNMSSSERQEWETARNMRTLGKWGGGSSRRKKSRRKKSRGKVSRRKTRRKSRRKKSRRKKR